jgi:hypothetical protein
MFTTSAYSFGEHRNQFRKEISVPSPYVAVGPQTWAIAVLGSIAPGPSFRHPGPFLGLGWKPIEARPLRLIGGFRLPTGRKERLINPYRLMIGIGIER